MEGLTEPLKKILPESKLREIREKGKQGMERVAGEIAGDPDEGRAVLF